MPVEIFPIKNKRFHTVLIYPFTSSAYLLVNGHIEDGEGEHGDDAVGDHVDVDEIYLDTPLRQSQICGKNKHIVLRIFINN